MTKAIVGLMGAILLAPGAAAQDRAKIEKPKSTALTVYNGGFALVRERRMADLAVGRNRIVVEDVASGIDPTSVHFVSLTAPGAVSVREQNYLYDLINPTTLLNKSVGKRVSLRQKIGNGQVVSVEGTIVTPVSVAVAQTGEQASGGTETVYNGLVLRTDDGRLLLNPTGEILLHEMPPGLIPSPQLVWLADCSQAGRHEAEISYLTQGMTWKTDYVAVLDAGDAKLDLTGWVTLDNRSGATYEMAGLQLIAGDVRRVQPKQLRVEMLARPAARAVPDAPAFQEESFFEYHLYTLDGATTVRNNEQKQMTLLSAHGAAMQKRLIYDGRQGFWGIRNPGYFPGEGYDTSANMKVRVVVEAKNSRPGLGIPLPKGTVRLFKADSRGNLQFIGEDEIDHTPKDELIRLHVGDSFDVVGEHKRTDFKRIGPKEVEETFEVLVRNRREQAEEVSVVEHLWQDWRVTAKSAEFVKKDAHTIEFRVKLQPGAEGKVTYTVRTRWN